MMYFFLFLLLACSFFYDVYKTAAFLSVPLSFGMAMGLVLLLALLYSIFSGRNRFSALIGFNMLMYGIVSGLESGLDGLYFFGFVLLRLFVIAGLFHSGKQAMRRMV